MSFSPGSPSTRQFEHTEIAPEPPITEEEWAERQRLHAKRHELRRIKSVDLKIDGHTYCTDHNGCMHLPVERVNELLDREIDLGGGNTLRLFFQTVR